MSGDAETIRIYFRTCAKIIECANSKKCFDTRRRVTARIPPPKSFVSRAGVDALNFSRENRVHHEANIAIARKPFAVALINRLVAVADAIGVKTPMTALV